MKEVQKNSIRDARNLGEIQYKDHETFRAYNVRLTMTKFFNGSICQCIHVASIKLDKK